MQGKPIIITSGEPAGIGPDIIVKLAAQGILPANSIVVADPELLKQRARVLNQPVSIRCVDIDYPVNHKRLSGELLVFPIPLAVPCTAGQLNALNAGYVIETLKVAALACLAGKIAALLTGPVHKGIINEAGIVFNGHTEFLAQMANVPQVVMMLMSDTPNLKIALVTTHLPLAKVSQAITPPLLEKTLRILQAELVTKFAIQNPRILVCGLNPHAGENGHLGREDIEIIMPVVEKLKAEGFNLRGPLPADTIFITKHLQGTDAILTMYHDQGLPVLKYAAFERAVNLTLGLPFIRISVDHGVALDLAGTGKINLGSFKAALDWVEKLA